MTKSKSFYISISVDIPYPKKFEFNKSASGVVPAIGRAMRDLRKTLKGRRIKKYVITSIQL